MNKNKILIIICISLFGVLGIYLTFFAGNTNKFDSRTKAYKIDSNESLNDDGTTYYPIYYFKVDNRDYQCKSKTGSSSIPNEKKNIVYYDSKNPEECMTQYEKATSKTVGIICLVITTIILFLILKNPSSSFDKSNKSLQIDTYRQNQIEDISQKLIAITDKVQFIYKRIIIGIIIVVLLILIIIDSFIVKQTIQARNYIETTATYVNKRSTDDIFDDCIYTFKDKQGKEQEIIVALPKDDIPKDKIAIKYDEKNPQKHYIEGAVMSKSGIIWYVIKIAVLILLIVLFFNKNLLNKINISPSKD